MRLDTILTLIFLIIFFSLYTCSEPTPPEFANPIDPDNLTTSEDPFSLKASLGSGGILLSWDPVNLSSISGYKIYRKESQETDFGAIGNTENTIYTDTAVVNGCSYSYKVAALGPEGTESTISNIAGITINTAPVIIINNGDEYTPSRNVTLSILAHTATQMKISNSAGFSGSDWETYATVKNWDLAAGDGKKTVYLQVNYGSDTISVVSSDDILPLPMNPSIKINNDSTYTSSRSVQLNLSAAGTNIKIIAS